MATLIQDPGWEDDDRPRVLVEATEWGHRHALRRLLDRHGYATASCPGPEGADDRCPLAAGGVCRAADEADIVLHALRPTDERNREVLLALQQRSPSARVVVEVAEPVVQARPDDYAGCVVVSSPMTPASLLELLSRET